jgi:hypothetical protein
MRTFRTSLFENRLLFCKSSTFLRYLLSVHTAVHLEIRIRL